MALLPVALRRHSELALKGAREARRVFIPGFMRNFLDANIAFRQQAGRLQQPLPGQQVAQRNSHLLFEQVQQVIMSEIEPASQPPDGAGLP